MGYLFAGPPTKTVTLTSATSSLSFIVNDLYSRWVDWVASGTGAGVGEVFNMIGGEPIDSVGNTAGAYLFIGLGWSIVVPVGIDSVEVIGNLVRNPLDESGAPLFTNTAGALITLDKSVVAIGYSSNTGSGLDSGQAAQLTAAAASAARAESLLEADENITPTRYQKIAAGGTEVLRDKDVTDDGNGNITLVERS